MGAFDYVCADVFSVFFLHKMIYGINYTSMAAPHHVWTGVHTEYSENKIETSGKFQWNVELGWNEGLNKIENYINTEFSHPII
jgi:hypothetical protein